MSPTNVRTKLRCNCNWDHRADYQCPTPGYDWRCMRCGHEWRSHHPDVPPPRQCVRCRSSYWDRPRVRAIKKGRGKGGSKRANEGEGKKGRAK